ncbi:TetR/AcrR family transcriptional regulator C-terminal domain-containing protein [Goodfellowiella coeruleoviolacea]|uniref:Transcriptional regulator, TetR family n=1 Tax=Goodfellowiella coeruleoviolacea TaxID=334858 RepID=A0AAE3GEE2_9PSEU|nr:TetR/AcrR family transcriptional regulator C-terminal domain-containing protein [Goodfellowiella coeruleoviolacea]MCP2165762.1 transcriptional regulator, TetR family [Goodfellowiella coeruleoviolacea]
MVNRRRSRPRVGLTRERVLDAALALVDSDGLAGLSMRKLGAALGVEAMSLYHYVPNKDALLDGLVELVLGMVTPEPPPQHSSWPDWVRQFAVDYRQVLLRHPAVLPLMATRPMPTTSALTTVELGLRRLVRAGLTARQALDILNSVTTFVLGHVLIEARKVPGHEAAAFTPNAMLVDLDEEVFPLISRAMKKEGAFDEQARFEYALNAMLEGFALAVARAADQAAAGHPVGRAAERVDGQVADQDQVAGQVAGLDADRSSTDRPTG